MWWGPSDETFAVDVTTTETACSLRAFLVARAGCGWAPRSARLSFIPKEGVDDVNSQAWPDGVPWPIADVLENLPVSLTFLEVRTAFDLPAASLTHLTGLTELHVSLATDSREPLDALGRLTSLEKLTFGIDEAAYLAPNFGDNGPDELRSDGSDGSDGLRMFQDTYSFPASLRHLDVHHMIEPIGFRELFSALRSATRLESLCVDVMRALEADEAEFQDFCEGLSAVVTASGLTRLRTLSTFPVPECVTDFGLRSMWSVRDGQVVGGPGVTRLCMGSAMWTDVELDQLGNVLRIIPQVGYGGPPVYQPQWWHPWPGMASLRVLDMSGSSKHVLSHGLPPPPPSLDTLSLAFCDLDEFPIVPESAHDWRNLRALDLRGNSFDARALEESCLRRLTNLETVRVLRDDVQDPTMLPCLRAILPPACIIDIATD